MAKLINLATGAVLNVHATTNHPSSSYGQPVWVDDQDENTAYCVVGFEAPVYKVDGRGGARSGAGRPVRGTGNRKSLACRVSPETHETIRAVAKETGESVGTVVDFIVSEYVKTQG